MKEKIAKLYFIYVIFLSMGLIFLNLLILSSFKNIFYLIITLGLVLFSFLYIEPMREKIFKAQKEESRNKVLLFFIMLSIILFIARVFRKNASINNFFDKYIISNLLILMFIIYYFYKYIKLKLEIKRDKLK